MIEAVLGPDIGLGGFVVDPSVNGLHLPSQATAQLYRWRNGVKLLAGEMAVNGCDAFPKDDGQFFDVLETFCDHGCSFSDVQAMSARHKHISSENVNYAKFSHPYAKLAYPLPQILRNHNVVVSQLIRGSIIECLCTIWWSGIV